MGIEGRMLKSWKGLKSLFVRSAPGKELTVEFSEHSREVFNTRFFGNIPEESSDPLVIAHRHSFANREELRSSRECGCFYCLTVFPPAEVIEWHDEGQTGFCPRCGIDALIGDSSGLKLDHTFLERMNRRWFGTVTHQL
jgi:hypothetical protein